MYKDNSILAKFRNGTKTEKTFYIVLAIIVLIALLIFSIYLGGRINWFLAKDYRDMSHFWLGIYQGGFRVSAIIFIVITGIILWNLFSNYTEVRNRISETDERGVATAKKGTQGSSHWATDEEQNNSFNIRKIEETKDIIFAQKTKGGEQVYEFKEIKNAPSGTKHILVLAKSGAGKSDNFVKANIVQAIKRGDSVVVVDPSGELYLLLGQYCRDKNYDVKLLNLANLEYSEYWNCLQECIDENTGRVQSDRITVFTQNYLINSATVNKQDFWLECAQNLIETTIGYLGFKREDYIINKFILLYQKITGEIASDFENMCKQEFVSLNWLEKEILNLAIKSDYELEKVDEYIKEVKLSAPEFNVGKLYETLHNINDIEKDFINIPHFHPSFNAYQRYSLNKTTAVVEGAKQGATAKFKIFDDYKLKEVLSNDGINFKTINLKPSIYFVSIPDTNSRLQPIASLFFAFYFKDAQENYDYEIQLAEYEHRNSRTIPVMTMMDEFASLGIISGKEKDFETIMSDCRKRDIYNIIVLQHIAQLKAIYGMYEHGIKSAVQTTVCLGVSKNDIETKDFVEKLSGKMTVVATSHREVDKLIGSRIEDNTVSLSETARYLLTSDETSDIGTANMNNKIVVFRDGCYPFKCNLFWYKDMPEFKSGEIRKVSYLENIKSLTERTIEKKKNKKERDSETKANDLLKLISDNSQSNLKSQKKKDKNKGQSEKFSDEQTNLFEEERN